MITFTQVSGPCLINDGKIHRVAQTGMTIQNLGDKCVIATGEGGRASLLVDGHLINLGANSWIRVRPGASRTFKFIPSSKDLKIGVGKLWKTVFETFGGRYDSDFNEGRGGGGIRG